MEIKLNKRAVLNVSGSPQDTDQTPPQYFYYPLGLAFMVSHFFAWPYTIPRYCFIFLHVYRSFPICRWHRLPADSK